MLCKKCSNIHLQPLGDCEVIKRSPEMLLEKHETDDDALFYFHHPSRVALERSAEAGCHFCAMMFDRLFGDARTGSTTRFEGRFVWDGVLFHHVPTAKWSFYVNGGFGILVSCGRLEIEVAPVGEITGILTLWYLFYASLGS